MDSIITDTICNYFKDKPIDKAWIFGSFARNEERPDSDIDILITLAPNTHMGWAFAGMVCDLEDRLHRNVDLVIDGDLLPFAAENANRDKVLIYERTN